ncbi:MAG: hypothetical protein AB7N80_09075 [Bdellovibrionales bacterium]
MRQSASQLTQSRFYSPAFNAAIFDGPVRIYFAQYQEALALKIYFRLQDRLQGWLAPEHQLSRSRLPNVFLMLYPTEEIFANCFSGEQCQDKVVAERLGEDHVIGVCGPLREEDSDRLLDRIEAIAAKWQGAPLMTQPLALAEF